MRITTAAQAAACDAAAIASGIDSWELMHAAGKAAAQFVALVATRVNAPAIFVWAGSGNNGGDAFVVAAELLNNGFNVVLREVGEPRTVDAKRARALFQETRAAAPPAGNFLASSDAYQFVFVDGLLGTGQHGALREPERELTSQVASFRADGGIVIALDVPTGLNATTGEIVEDAVRADYTLSFGTLKRAHVLQREQCGEIVVLDIGLGEFGDLDNDAWTLADAELLSGDVPPITWDAHKGSRGKLAIVGGAEGMAGAVILASDAALRSGVGLVYAHANVASVLPLQISVPQAIAKRLTPDGISGALKDVGAVVVGPGFGRNAQSETLLHAVLEALVNDVLEIPVVLDADAITLIGSDTDRLALLAQRREVVCTPHVREFGRMVGSPVADSLEDRVAQVQELVARTGCTVLLKGTPTVVIAPNASSPIVVPRGTSVLATGGSGDMLSGIIGTLLSQGADGLSAAAIAAWVHGRAAELATESAGAVRGVTLTEVISALPDAWRELTTPMSLSQSEPVQLASLPRVWSESVL